MNDTSSLRSPQRIGRMVFGESMFSRATDASKIALAALVAFCAGRGIPLIDCQQNTGHLASLGAREIARADFERHLALTCGGGGDEARIEWTYDEAHWRLLGVTGGASESPAQIQDPPA